MNHDLALHILNHLDAAGDYRTPESTLKLTLSRLVRPTPTVEVWADTVQELVQLDYIGFRKDTLTKERQFFIKEGGQNYRDRA